VYSRIHERVLMMQSAQDRFREHERACRQLMAGFEFWRETNPDLFHFDERI
jgi:hypothetical protein